MAGRAASLERLDDSHPAAAAWAWVDRLICCGFCCGGTVGRLLLLHRLHRCRRRDQIARPRDGLRLAAAGQQPVVPDAVEAVRQDVDQKPADELAWLERHGLVAAGPLDPVVFVAKRNAGRVGGDKPAVGDGDPVGVARQIGQHLLGPGKRSLAIDEPLSPPASCGARLRRRSSREGGPAQSENESLLYRSPGAFWAWA